MSGGTVVERIRSERLVAVLRRVPDLDAVVDAVVAGGIRVVEVTLDSEHALAALDRLARREELAVLAGTVRTPEQAEAAARVGAEACVSPVLDAAVVERCRQLGITAIPGALTPSELAAAAAFGVPLVKLFPGRLGGPEYVREVLAPLSGLELLVTGGIDAANARAFLDAGAVAVGVGSALTAAVDVEAEARRLVEGVR